MRSGEMMESAPETGHPKVAVIVVNWNGREDLLECLESLKGITYPNYRIIVVDNGSSDGSADNYYFLSNRTSYRWKEAENNGGGLYLSWDHHECSGCLDSFASWFPAKTTGKKFCC